jgi:hypothetical protein
LTYKHVTKSDSEVYFEREKSNFLKTAFIVGGLLIILFGIITPSYPFLKFILIVFGLAFFGAAFYLPEFGNRFLPDIISIDKHRQEITVTMADRTYCKLPFDQIKGFEIAVEKRSPSAANSAGIHYLHHHVDLKRTNGATFTITSTTDKQEAEQVCNLLKQTLSVETSAPSKIECLPPNKIQIQDGKPLEITWQSNRYRLSIGNLVKYAEYKSDGTIEASKEFPVVNFSHVAYSYASTIQNRNFSVYIYFNQSEQIRLGLFLKDLNPVECLQFENWLHQTIQKKLSA